MLQVNAAYSHPKNCVLQNDQVLIFVGYSNFFRGVYQRISRRSDAIIKQNCLLLSKNCTPKLLMIEDLNVQIRSKIV